MPSKSWGGEEMDGDLSTLRRTVMFSPSPLRSLYNTHKEDALAEGTSQS